MRSFNRFNDAEIQFLERFNEDFHAAMKQVMLKIDGPAIDDPKFEVLSSRIEKLEKKLGELDEFVNNKAGGY